MIIFIPEVILYIEFIILYLPKYIIAKGSIELFSQPSIYCFEFVEKQPHNIFENIH